MTWPIWTILVLQLLGAGFVIAKFGEPKLDTYSFGDLIAIAVQVWLLWMGGFYSPLA